MAKVIGEFVMEMRVEQVHGGYVTEGSALGGPQRRAHIHFESMINHLARSFGLLEIGERFVLSATREPQEGVNSMKSKLDLSQLNG
jgi:hypothetical protein